MAYLFIKYYMTSTIFSSNFRNRWRDVFLSWGQKLCQSLWHMMMCSEKRFFPRDKTNLVYVYKRDLGNKIIIGYGIPMSRISRTHLFYWDQWMHTYFSKLVFCTLFCTIHFLYKKFCRNVTNHKRLVTKWKSFI